MEIKKGDLFYTSWGYDQTNYDYIIVLEVSKTGKTAICQRARHNHLGNDGHGSDLQKPIPIGFGEKFKMQVKYSTWRGDTDEKYLRGSYPFLHTGEGSRRLDSFFKTKPEAIYRETDAYHGH
jgi:hypothetical protein